MFSARSIVSAIMMAGSMSFFIGSAIVFFRSGLDGFLAAFLSTWPLAFAVAFPTSLFVAPLVQRAVNAIFGPDTSKEKA